MNILQSIWNGPVAGYIIPLVIALAALIWALSGDDSLSSRRDK